MEVVIINNDSYIIKGRIDSDIYEALKTILSIKGMTQQDLIDLKIKEFVLQNLNLIISKDVKGSK